MASHAQRLQMSKCMSGKHATGDPHAAVSNHAQLTCISCHNPHVSVKVTGKQVFNKSCNKCHSAAQQNFCTEKPAVLKAADYNCVKCHMPKSGTIDIPHVTVTDHWIRVPATAAVKNKVKEFAGIYCINNYKSDEETRGRAYIGHYEKFSGEKSSIDSAMKYLDAPSLPVKNTDALIHLWYVKQDYASIIRTAATLKPAGETKPWLCYRIGRAYFNNSNMALAEAWYKRAVELAPENLDFINSLGALYVNMDEHEKALQVLNNSLGKNPKQSEPLANIGFIYAKQQQFDKALEYYNKAIALDPDLEQALLNKAGVLNITGRRAVAKQLLQRLLRLDPQNAMVKELLRSLGG
jgi:Flp pilus assembly protein TadD